MHASLSLVGSHLPQAGGHAAYAVRVQCAISASHLVHQNDFLLPRIQSGRVQNKEKATTGPLPR